MRETTVERWGSVQIALHWTIAALVLLVQVPAGITMAAVDPGPVQNVCYNIHKTNGIVIFLLALIRRAQARTRRSRKSAYASCSPASRQIDGLHPRSVRRRESSALRGVPSGFVASHTISMSAPTTSRAR